MPFVLIPLATILLLFSGCQSPIASSSSATSGSQTTAANPPNSIVIAFPSDSSRAVTITTATTYSNFYQVIAYNASHIYYSTV